MPITAAVLAPHPPLLVPEVGRSGDDDLDQLRCACRSAVATMLDQVEALLVVGPAESWGRAAPGTPGSFRPYGPPVEVVLPGAGPPRTASAADWLDRMALPSKQVGELPLSLAVAAWLLSQEARVRDLPEVAAFTIPASLEAGPAAAAGRAVAAAAGTGRGAETGAITGTGPGPGTPASTGTAAAAGTGSGAGTAATTDTGAAARSGGSMGTGGTSAGGSAGTRVGLLVMGDLSARRTARAPGSFHPAAEDFDRGIGDAIRKAELDRLLDLDPALAAELRVGGTAALWLLAGAFHGAGEPHGEVRYEAAPFGVGYLVGVIEAR
jgi:hypothetical protein